MGICRMTTHANDGTAVNGETNPAPVFPRRSNSFEGLLAGNNLREGGEEVLVLYATYGFINAARVNRYRGREAHVSRSWSGQFQEKMRKLCANNTLYVQIAHMPKSCMNILIPRSFDVLFVNVEPGILDPHFNRENCTHIHEDGG